MDFINEKSIGVVQPEHSINLSQKATISLCRQKGSSAIVEAFGNVFGKKKSEEETEYSIDAPPQSIQETLQRIQDDFGRSYFLSGDVDALIYDENCIFSDPFVSFAGRERFISNLANLGSFVTKFSARQLEFKADDPLYVKTKVTTRSLIECISPSSGY